MSPRDSNHLFVYLANATHLTHISVWSDSVGTARFLRLPLDDFDENQLEPLPRRTTPSQVLKNMAFPFKKLKLHTTYFIYIKYLMKTPCHMFREYGPRNYHPIITR